MSTLVGASPSLPTFRGVHKTTDATGTAEFKWGYRVKGKFTVGITKAGYWRLTKRRASEPPRYPRSR